ncbi:MAG TPA: peptidoglycan-binding protein [Bacilli bacterium]
MPDKFKKLAVISAVCLALLIPLQTVNAFGVGSRGPDVYAVQSMLKTLGYYPGAIDGIYGAQTALGVKLFQRRYGLPVTGVVDFKTLQSILWAYAEAKKPRPPVPAPQAPVPKAPNVPGLSAEEQQMVNLVNGERTKRGLRALAINLELARTARIKSREMVDKHYFSHQSPTYGSPFDMMRSFGISFTAAGENIACNQSVAAAHQALMNSPGHRENILNASFTQIGIGIANGGMCGKMFTEQFIGK